MIKYIGIAACSTEGTELCYRTICIEGEEVRGIRYYQSKVSIHIFHLSDSDYTKIPLLPRDEEFPSPAMNSTKILAMAAIKKAFPEY